MCLAEVCQVRTTGSDDDAGTVDLRGRERRVSFVALSAPAAPGDWVVVHCGFALARLTEEEARAALARGRPGSRPPRRSLVEVDLR